MSGRRTSWFAAGRDERGSILPMTALMVTVVLGFTAFAVDLGLNRVAVRDMQSVADAVALDTARSPALSSCNASTLTQVANASLARQQARMGRTQPLQVEPGRVDAAGAFTTAGSGCNAVRITSRTEVDYAFAPVIGTDSGTARRSAVGARSQPAICFSAGTRALVLNSSGSALGPLLDRILRVNFAAVGYTGLVDLKDVSVPIADLSSELGVGTPEALATTSVTLQQFVLATAAVLDRQGNAVQATLLNTLSARLTSPSFSLGDVLTVGPLDGAATDVRVNVLDLLGSAIVRGSIANGNNAVVLGTDLGLPGDLLNASSRMTIIEAPRIACGPTGTQARTAQVRIDLRSGLNVLGIVSAADIDMGIRVASGTASLGPMNCTSPATAQVTAQTAGAQVVGYGGSGQARINVVGLRILGIPIFEIGLNLIGSVASTSDSHTFTYPAAPGLPATHTFGSPANLNVDINRSGLAGLILGPVVELLTTVLNPVLENLLTPVLRLLGIRLGTMDVTLLGRPSCTSVRLAG